MAESMNKIQTHLLGLDDQDFTAYYNGKMSYKLHGTAWNDFVRKEFTDIAGLYTSENIYKTVVDLYAENLVPLPTELRGFSNILVPLLARGQAPAVLKKDGTPSFPEHYEIISDGTYSMVAIFTRDLAKGNDYVVFVDSLGAASTWAKEIPAGFGPADKTGYRWVENDSGYELFRFALDDKGLGKALAALQDRTNHSIIDQTVIAEMYARPFWYLLNTDTAPTNPFLPPEIAAAANADSEMKEQKVKGTSGRVFTTNSAGPFGQLEPPTIGDMIAYHDSIIDKVSQSFGIPMHYLKPGTGTPPTGVALKVLSKRYNNRVARIRDDLQPELERLAEALGVQRTVDVKDQKQKDFELWNTSDDLLQDALDQHGINLSQIGYPIDYIAEVVTPGVNLNDYANDSLDTPVPPATGQPTDMTALGQKGLPATPGQVQAYAQNPGQRAAGAK